MEQEGAFSSTVTQDNFYVVAPKVEVTQTFRQALGNFFALAHVRVWMFTVLIVLYVALAMYSIEGDPLPGDKETEDPAVKAVRKGAYHISGAADVPMAMVVWFWDHIQGMCNAVYLGFSGLVGGTSVTECKTAEGRLINLGFGVFILSFITAITGVVAANVVTTQFTGLQSVEMVMATGVTVCSNPIVTPALKSLYPELKLNSLKGVLDLDSGYEAMAAGECGAVIQTADEWSSVMRGDYPRCDRTRVGNPVFATPLSMPVRTEFVPVLSWMLTKARSKGWIEEEKVKAKAAYFKRDEPECHTTGSIGNVQEEDGKIKLAHLTGPLLITFVCTTVSLLFHLFQKLSCVANAEGKAKAKLRKSVSNKKRQSSAAAECTDEAPVGIEQLETILGTNDGRDSRSNGIQITTEEPSGTEYLEDALPSLGWVAGAVDEQR
jgi:hypothetical protein